MQNNAQGGDFPKPVNGSTEEGRLGLIEDCNEIMTALTAVLGATEALRKCYADVMLKLRNRTLPTVTQLQSIQQLTESIATGVAQVTCQTTWVTHGIACVSATHMMSKQTPTPTPTGEDHGNAEDYPPRIPKPGRN